MLRTDFHHRPAVVRGIGLIAAVVTAGLLLGASINPAAAETRVKGRGYGSAVTIGGLGWWAGAYNTTKGLGFCLQPTRNWSSSVGLSDPKPLTSFTNDQKVKLTTAQLNQLAYVMWRASESKITSNKVAVTYKLVTMTLAGYDHVRIFSGGRLSTRYFDFSLDNPKSHATSIAISHGVLPQAKALLEDARNNANNWDGTGKLTLVDEPSRPGEDMTVVAELPGLGSGVDVVFEVTPPLGETESLTVATEEGVATLTVPVTEYGAYEVRAKLARKVPPRYPLVAVGKTTQSLLIVSDKARTWSSRLSHTIEIPTPTITTKISKQVILPGETIRDIVEVAELVESARVSYVINGGLYATLPEDDGSCPDADSPAWEDPALLVVVEGVEVPVEEGAGHGVSAKLKVGKWTVPADQIVMCVSYGEAITMLVDGEVAVVVEHPAGSPEQTGLVKELPKPKPKPA